MSPHFKKIIVPIHCFFVLAMILLFTGVVSPIWLWSTFVGWILIGGFGIAIGFHRLISHKSFQTTNFMQNVLVFLGSMGAQGSVVFWASIHQGLHHPFADTKKDLHSPIHGMFNSFIGWQMYIKAEDVPFRVGAMLGRDLFIKFTHKYYNSVYWGTVLVVAAISWKLALFGVLVPGFISAQQENFVDLFCHLPKFGYRNHDTKDQSVNNIFLGYFGFGHGWHNNHHARPNSYDFGGDRWWEFDVCSILIPLIAIKNQEATELVADGPKL